MVVLFVSLLRNLSDPEGLRDLAARLMTRANRLDGWQEV